MKSKMLLLIFHILIFTGCKKEESKSQPPTIPPFETMVVDFGSFSNVNKSAQIVQTKTNWTYSALVIGFWNTMIGTTFAIPVAAFKASFNNLPIPMEKSKWMWSYSVNGFASQYNAKLIAELTTSQIIWKMFISKTGIGSFDEMLWFEGTSMLDGKSGQWILYHSPQFPEKTVQIDWKKTGEEIGEVKYTLIRELDDDRQPEKAYGSYLAYGLRNETFDAYVNTHVYYDQSNTFQDTFIEWSRSNHSGHVKAEQFFNNNDWHCWDSSANDTNCN